MAPKQKKGKGKRPVGSSSSFNTERFPDVACAERFESRFINRTVILERIVVENALTNTRFIQWLHLNRLMMLSNLNGECFEDWVREFYCNMFEVTDNSFQTYVRGKTLTVNADIIATSLDLVRSARKCYPFDADIDNIVIEANQVASVLCGRPIVWNTPILKISGLTTDYRLLNTFVCHNIEPRGHKSDLLYPQAFLLYSLGTGTSVDIPLTILESMLRVYNEERKLTLPFGAMICKLMFEAGCQAYTHELSVYKRQKIDGRTIAMSDTHIRGRLQMEHGHLQGEEAQVQADEADADSIENRLSAIEHAVFDQSIQIEQLEERVSTGFFDLSNQLTAMFNQLRHQ